MSYGTSDKGQFGFYSIKDWFDSVVMSFPAPWRVGSLDGKYYGTRIQDARGLCILTVWLPSGEPSARQCGNMVDGHLAFSRSYRDRLKRRSERVCKHCGELRQAVDAVDPVGDA